MKILVNCITGLNSQWNEKEKEKEVGKLSNGRMKSKRLEEKIERQEEMSSVERELYISHVDCQIKWRKSNTVLF